MRWVLFVSILLNATAVVFAVTLMRLTGRPVGWLLLSMAFVFMLIHSLTELLAGGNAATFLTLHLRLEFFELLASAAVVFGMANIRRSFVERELARRQVAIAERQWVDTFDAIAIPIFLHDAEFRILRANRTYFAAAGKPAREVIGKPYWTIWPAGEGPLPGCVQALDTGTYGVTEVATDGRLFEARSYVVQDEGRYAYSIHAMADVTERRHQEEALRESEAHYRTLFEKSPTPIMVIDQQGNYLDVNDATLKFFEAEKSAVIGHSVFEFSPRQGPQSPEETHRPLLLKYGGVIETPYWVKGLTHPLIFSHCGKHFRQRWMRLNRFAEGLHDGGKPAFFHGRDELIDHLALAEKRMGTCLDGIGFQIAVIAGLLTSAPKQCQQYNGHSA